MARLPPANFCILRFEPLGPLDSSSRPPPAHSAVSASRPFSGRIRGLPLGRDVGRRSGLRSACAAVRLAPRLTPVRRRAGGPPQAAPPPIASRRDAARSPEPTARRPMRCRRSARVSRVLGRRAPGAAPEGRPRATCARVCGTAASLHRHHAARHGCRGGGLGGAHIRRSDQPRTAHAGSSSRGAGAHNGAQEARGHLHVLRSAPAAGCREPGASPLRARPPGRQARAPCCPWALRRAGRRRPIAHERRGVVPGSLPFQGGRCGLRPRRAGSCGGRAAYPRLSTHQVPRSRLAHAY